VHWIFGAGMIALAAEEVFNGLSFRAFWPAEVMKWQQFKLIPTALLLGIWLLFSMSYGRTNYKETLAKWRWVVLATFAIPLSLVTLFGDSLFKSYAALGAPSVSLIRLSWSGYLFYFFFLLSSVLILMNLERTLRNSTGSLRWQIKFMVLGLGSIFAVRIYTGSQTLLFQSLDMALEVVNAGILILASILIIWSLTRTRLLNIDVYLSQSFLYNSVTVLIVGIYLLAVGILAKVASYFNISHTLLLETLLILLALMGLIIIVLSNKLRQQIKRFVNLHLQRPRYDYRIAWTSFTQRTTSLLEIKDICTAVTKMVSETFGTPCVTIWLLDDAQEKLMLAGSTVFSSTQVQDTMMGGKGVGDLIKAMRDQQMPVDFVLSENGWAGKLRQSNLGYFNEAQIRYCVSLIAAQEFLGIMTLNERLMKEPFSVEDINLLKTIADQAAGSILNIEMSERLRRAKEIEAFQTISTFILHDLKNLASKLSLTMQNLPIHFNNPEFRNDALRAISESVAKINTMCGSLSLLRQKVVLQKTETDLNELVTTTLASLDSCCKSTPIRDLESLPRLVMDPEQLQKVLTNLVLNATEAVGNGGEIRVATRQKDGWVVLSVSDNGCGMSKEFIEKSLFRPFQTTKKQGMGIGLFHSKMIVEAHQGRIEVESEVGKGTTFRVMLPVKEV